MSDLSPPRAALQLEERRIGARDALARRECWRVLIPHSLLVAPPNPERRFRLLEQVRGRARERRYSERTIGAYVHWIRQFVIHFGRRHPRELGAEHVRDFRRSSPPNGMLPRRAMVRLADH